MTDTNEQVEEVVTEQPEDIEKETQAATEKAAETTEETKVTSTQTVQQTSENTEKLEAVIAQLKSDNAELQEKLIAVTAELEQLKASKETVDTEATTAKAQAENYESVLKAVVEEKSAVIPEAVRALMPENITVAEQVEWLKKAEAAIPKQEEKEEDQIISIGRPTPVQTKVVDESALSVGQKLSNAFADILKK